jgi:hypothetical protein
VLSYTLPAEPSSKRVLVWRHLKKLGAVSQSGIWLLPRTPHLAAEFDRALTEIKALGGQALAFHATDLDAGQKAELRDLYNGARREEYLEIDQLCRRYLGHLQRLSDAGDFRFSALEEMEQDLDKRRRTYAQVVERDAFGVDEQALVEASLGECEAALEEFAKQAYLAQSGETPT